MLNHIATDIRHSRSIDLRFLRRSPKPAAANSDKVVRARTKWSNFVTQHKPDFRTFVDEVLDQRRRLDHATLESFEQSALRRAAVAYPARS